MGLCVLTTLVDQAVPEDSKRIVELLWQRPDENTPHYSPHDQGYTMVARVDGVVQAFFAGTIEGPNLVVKRLECEHENGEPTKAGKKGAGMLVRFIRAFAQRGGFGIVTVVAIDNTRFLEHLFDRGGSVTAVVVSWPPGFPQSRRRKRTTE